MNAEKLTQKSAEAIRSAQEIALEYGNPQIEQVHLLWALLQDSEGLIPQLLAGMGVTVPSLQAAVKDLLRVSPGSPIRAMRREKSTSLVTRKRP